jgi:hypothetical protein
MSTNINDALYKELDKFFNNTSTKNTQNQIIEKQPVFNKLYLLVLIIEKALFEKVLLEILIIDGNGKRTFHKDFNIIFSIFKKIYEARNTKILVGNYILKFIKSLDNKEVDFIESLLNTDDYIKNFLESKGITTYNPKIFKTIYKKYKHTNNVYEILGGPIINFFFNDKTTILNPNIKQNKYIIIPDDNASNLKKLYFILLVVFSSCVDNFLDNVLNISKYILFFKKILLSYNKNTISVNPNEDVKFAFVLGCLCNFDFSFFIKTIADKIIEEKNEKETNTNTKVKSSKNISDLFEIFFELNIFKEAYVGDISFIKSIKDISVTLPDRFITPPPPPPAAPNILNKINMTLNNSASPNVNKNMFIEIVDLVSHYFNIKNGRQISNTPNIDRLIYLINEINKININTLQISYKGNKSKFFTIDELKEIISLLNPKIDAINQKMKDEGSSKVIPYITSPL